VRDIVSTSGTALDHVVYDSFGNVLTETNAGNGDRFKFAGMEYDSVTGQYYDRARYYNPTTGCFESQDPIRFSGGDSNLYRYVTNSPTLYTDPSGTHKQDNFYGYNDPRFRAWFHRFDKLTGKNQPNATRQEIKEHHDDWLEQGEPDGEGHRTRPKNSDDNNYQATRHQLTTTVATVIGVGACFFVVAATAPIWFPVVSSLFATYFTVQYTAIAIAATCSYAMYTYSASTAQVASA
jgi:RHS repeat-associated protein